MAKYVNAVDLSDPSLTITEAHADMADVDVDAALRERGIDPAALTLPIALLTQIAGNFAKRHAAIEGAIGDDSPLIAKAREFNGNAVRLLGGINRAALGLAVPAGAGYGNVVLGRS
ncbi:hypothetical protein [Methylomicrobium lacus]|uniref:hypothetical protein n=1 Tax=Methylomicrobium lacus TaxID=136992 RepID=UPI00045EB3AC|nr:hypothetical protein [Methylomicrobium lacus]